jgi:hypothetical protein
MALKSHRTRLSAYPATLHGALRVLPSIGPVPTTREALKLDQGVRGGDLGREGGG